MRFKFYELYTNEILNCKIDRPLILYYILMREGIRFVQNVTPPHPVFVKCPRLETLCTRKNGFHEYVCRSICLYTRMTVCLYILVTWHDNF